MTVSSELNKQIEIECPECKQHFVVDNELHGRLVACGECEHEFRVSGDHIIERAKEKFYPGERARNLGGFTKKTPIVAVDAKVDFRTAAYEQQVDPAMVMPLGPRRIIAIFAGVVMFLVVIAVFALGWGAMADVDQSKRWILVIFASLIGSQLLVFGCRKFRKMGVILAGLLTAAVLSMPVFFPAKVTQASVPISEAELDLEMNVPESDSIQMKRYKTNIGYVAVENAIEHTGNAEKVVAYALKYTKPEHTATIMSYLSRQLKANEVPKVYEGTRKIGEVPIVLIIFSNVNVDFRAAAEFVSSFGEVATLRPELRVIEVNVIVDKISNTEVAVVGDHNNPGFYAANLRELNQLEPERQLSAIQRLGRVEKLNLRTDIVRQLMHLFRQPNYAYKPAIAKTLAKWAQPGDGADSMILGDAHAMTEQGALVPHEYLEFLVKQNVQNIGSLLITAWKVSPMDTENLMLAAGERVEHALVSDLNTMTSNQIRAAARLLQKIGTKNSLQSIKAVYDKSSGETKKSLKATIDEIESRE